MGNKLKNIFYYVEHNLSTFKESKLNEVDALIFSFISYFHIQPEVYKKGTFDSVYIKDFNNMKYYDKMLYDSIEVESAKKLVKLLSASSRFRDVEMLYYIETLDKNVEKQFSAMTFRCLNNNYFVSYRGTDHSFIGWKEDLNMAYLTNVPSQVEALEYLKKVMSKCKGSYYVGGHSKGGNLAVYATSLIDKKYKNRIKEVYNFDGPSLNKFLLSETDYSDIENRINKYVPQSSIVGMCFERTHNYITIKSDAIGVLQHNPFTWEVVGNELKRTKDSTFDSKIFKKAINTLIDSLSEQELKLVVDTLYKVMVSTNSETIEQFVSNVLNNVKNILIGYRVIYR